MKPRTTEFEALCDAYAEAVAAHEFGYAQNCSDQDNVNRSANDTQPAVDRTRAALIAWADNMHNLSEASLQVIDVIRKMHGGSLANIRERCGDGSHEDPSRPFGMGTDICAGCGRYRPAHHENRLCTEEKI